MTRPDRSYMPVEPHPTSPRPGSAGSAPAPTTAPESHNDRGFRHDVDDVQPLPPTQDVTQVQDITQLKRYEDFSTIDWVRDAAQEAARRRTRKRAEQRTQRRGLGHYQPWGLRARNLVTRWYLAAQTWVVLTLVGIAIGVNASFLTIITDWLSDIKLGHCSTGFYLSEKFCCWGNTEAEACPEWKRWFGFGPMEYWIYTTYAAIFAFSAAMLVKQYAPYAAGSGISEIKCIIAGFVMKGFLGFWTLVIKSLSLPLTIASGLSVGKEGPSLHYAVCTGNVISRLFSKYRQNAARTREILLASSAAGVGVAFGSPIGGVLFSLEEMSNYFSLKTLWRSYFCALVATWVLKSVNPLRTGQIVLFSVKYDRDWHFFEIIFYIILGILGGLYGAFVIRWNLRAQAFRKRYLGRYPVIEATFLAAFTAILCFPNAFLRTDMSQSMGRLFQECEGDAKAADLCDPSKRWSVVTSLVIAIILRVCLTIISYGCKVPAGIFVPSMAIGALFGRLVGILAQALQETFPDSALFSSCHPDTPCITPGTYAFLGAGAALSGIMHITVSVVVIMFELTGALTYILPTMIVVGVTKATSERFGHGGIADRMIWFNGFPYPHSMDGPALGVSVGQVMNPEIKSLPASGLTLSNVQSLLTEDAFQGYPIVTSADSSVLVGYIDRAELQYLVDRTLKDGQYSPGTLVNFGPIPTPPPSGPSLSADGPESPISPSQMTFPPVRSSSQPSDRSVLDFGWYIDQTPISVHPNTPLETVMDIFTRLGPRVILVAHRGDLLGLVTVKDCLRFQIKAEYAYTRRNDQSEQPYPLTPRRPFTPRRPAGSGDTNDDHYDDDNDDDGNNINRFNVITPTGPHGDVTISTTATADELSALDHRREERLWEFIVRVVRGLEWAGDQAQAAAWDVVVNRRPPIRSGGVWSRIGRSHSSARESATRGSGRMNFFHGLVPSLFRRRSSGVGNGGGGGVDARDRFRESVELRDQ